jgi:phage terminase large subunit-like protein
VQSWDTAIKTTVRSDWSVGITARYYQGQFYILDVFRKRVEFGALMRAPCWRGVRS